MTNREYSEQPTSALIASVLLRGLLALVARLGETWRNARRARIERLMRRGMSAIE